MKFVLAEFSSLVILNLKQYHIFWCEFRENKLVKPEIKVDYQFFI